MGGRFSKLSQGRNPWCLKSATPCRTQRPYKRSQALSLLLPQGVDDKHILFPPWVDLSKTQQPNVSETSDIIDSKEVRRICKGYSKKANEASNKTAKPRSGESANTRKERPHLRAELVELVPQLLDVLRAHVDVVERRRDLCAALGRHGRAREEFGRKRRLARFAVQRLLVLVAQQVVGRVEAVTHALDAACGGRCERGRNVRRERDCGVRWAMSNTIENGRTRSLSQRGAESGTKSREGKQGETGTVKSQLREQKINVK